MQRAGWFVKLAVARRCGVPVGSLYQWRLVQVTWLLVLLPPALY